MSIDAMPTPTIDLAEIAGTFHPFIKGAIATNYPGVDPINLSIEISLFGENTEEYAFFYLKDMETGNCYLVQADITETQELENYRVSTLPAGSL